MNDELQATIVKAEEVLFRYRSGERTEKNKELAMNHIKTLLYALFEKHLYER